MLFPAVLVPVYCALHLFCGNPAWYVSSTHSTGSGARRRMSTGFLLCSRSACVHAWPCADSLARPEDHSLHRYDTANLGICYQLYCNLYTTCGAAAVAAVHAYARDIQGNVTAVQARAGRLTLRPHAGVQRRLTCQPPCTRARRRRLGNATACSSRLAISTRSRVARGTGAAALMHARAAVGSGARGERVRDAGMASISTGSPPIQHSRRSMREAAAGPGRAA